LKHEIKGFEWHDKKNEINILKHKISFEEATTVFDDMFAVYKQDFEHSIGEERSYIIGHSLKNKLLVVAFTERNHNIRIITARNATKIERRYYEAQN